MVPHQELLVNGFFLGGPCDSSLPKQVVKSPWDGSVVGVAAESLWPQAEAALDAAAKAFLPWSRTPRTERQALLRKVASALREQAAEFAELMAKEIGKPITLGHAEVARAGFTFELSANLLDAPEWESVDVSYDPRSLGAEVLIRREPIGPIFCVTPFNWPVNLAAHKIAPALAVGNTVILKGSPLASLTTLAFARLIAECGLPPGVLNTVNCEPEIAERVATDDRVKMVSFTGSSAVGWTLKQKCWNKPVVLELGGAAPAYVGAGVNIESVAQQLAHSAFAYAGQVCVSAQNIFVDTDIYEPFRNALVAAAEAMPVRDPLSPESIVGPMIHEEAAKRVESWLSETSGSVLTGGQRAGNRLNPTVVDQPLPEDKVVCEEVFGPVVTLRAVDVPSLAMVEWNRSKFGLQASVFSPDEAVFDKFLRFVQTGTLIFNDTPSLRFDAMPYGGVKESGAGREGPRHAMAEMTVWKTVVRRRDSHSS